MEISMKFSYSTQKLLDDCALHTFFGGTGDRGSPVGVGVPGKQLLRSAAPRTPRARSPRRGGAAASTRGLTHAAGRSSNI